MKRVNNLFEKVIDTENLSLALHNAAKGKYHYREVKNIIKNPLPYIYALHEVLAAESFKNGKYHIFKRQMGKKERVIYRLPFYPDRVLHHALVQVLEPIWMQVLIHQTYSTIPKRGVHGGLKHLKRDLLKCETTYCLKLDIEKFYPSVNNAILLDILSRKIKDKRLMELLTVIVNSAEGIPIGNYISQWFGNMYLAYFDHYVKENLKCRYYYRYCDDLVLLSDSKETLFMWLESIRTYLKNELKLSLKDNYQIFPVSARGIDFLGYRFFKGYTLVRKSIVKQMKNRINSEKSMSSYYGWLIHADSYRLLKKYFSDKPYAQRFVA